MHKYLLLVTFLSFFSCSDNKPEQKDTPVTGQTHILADESFQPIVNAEIDVFHALYNKAHIKADYRSESEVIASFLQSEVDMVVTGRLLSEKEKQYLKESQKTYMENILAYDAVALIVHPDNPVTTLSTGQLNDILSGNVQTWSSIKPGTEGEISIVMDNSNSGNFNFLKNIFDFEASNIKIFAAGSNEKVIEYISNQKNAIGVIGANHISDFDNPDVVKILETVKVLDIAGEDGVGYSPFQSDIASGKYPLKREIILITTGKKSGLASGFTAFALSDRGQRIVLKSGLVPSHIPGREIVVYK